uniref:alpha-amylase n=3 Tax=Magallana gigas TaxID=29159 RepID=K1QDY3_MAGGI|eukprot:XP_011448249.1 PREDICTED: alpha-amylase [Crassostrea gigas]
MFQVLLWCPLFVGIVRGGTWSNPTCAPGRHTITHLFEWKWSDIAAECERFLGPKGYCGVQISPPSENRIVTNPNRPWEERYQPVSYKLVTRSGNEADLRDMIQRCNKVNVRIYADVVFNHMTGSGASGTGTGGSHWDSGTLSYPGVPFSAWDFNGGTECSTGDGGIHNYNDPNEVRNCRLLGMADLKLSKDYVRDTVAGYLNHLISLGVAGFRVDAAKHMWPGDLRAVFERLHDLNTAYFTAGTKPFIYLEVIDLGNEPIKAAEYTGIARVTDFIYGIKIAEVFRHHNQAKWLRTWGDHWGMPNSNDAVVFIDNHDTQRGHSGEGGVLTFYEPRSYKMATEFMLAHPYGFTRVMSSYRWNRDFHDGRDHNSWMGPPHNGDMSIKSPSIQPDMSCGNGWICEHRWRQIYNMVAFRNVVMGTTLTNWWDNGDYAIAFSRGNKGFIVINAGTSDINVNLQTGLSQGTYCDVISGNYENGSCTGNEVHVGGDGHAHFHISSGIEDPVIAIHIGAKKGSTKKVTT